MAGAVGNYDAGRAAYRQAHADELTGVARRGLDMPERTSLRGFLDAAAKVRAWRQQVTAFFERYDLLLTPTLPVASIPVNARELSINGVPQATGAALGGRCPPAG